MTKVNEKKVIIYEPNHIIKAGIRIWPEMVGELIAFRGLIWRLIVRDVTARYKQSLLGLFWSFLTPLVMTLVFVWIKSQNILPIKETVMPYAAFVFLGQMVWFLFSSGIILTAQSLVAAGPMLGKINFPKEVLVISAFGQTIFEFLLRIPLLLIVFVWTGFVPNFAILLLPVVLIPLLFLVIGLGFLVALFNAMLRDTGNLLALVVNLGMFATPVIYPPPTTWPMSLLVNYVNPISGFVIAARDLATSGYLSDPASLTSSSLVAFLLFLGGWRLFHLLEPKIAERI